MRALPFIQWSVRLGLCLVWLGCNPGLRSGGRLDDQTHPGQQMRIVEGTYAGRPHFIIHTPTAVYYYDKTGGDLSRLIDPEGRDGIGFWPTPWDA